MNEFSFKVSACLILLAVVYLISPELFEGTKGLINLIGFILFCGLSYYYSEPMDLSDEAQKNRPNLNLKKDDTKD
jgi:hypothetical protein